MHIQRSSDIIQVPTGPLLKDGIVSINPDNGGDLGWFLIINYIDRAFFSCMFIISTYYPQPLFT